MTTKEDEDKIIEEIERAVINRECLQGTIPNNVATLIKVINRFENIVPSRGWYNPEGNEVKKKHVPVHDCCYGRLHKPGSIFLVALVSGDKIAYRKGSSIRGESWKYSTDPSPHYLKYDCIKDSDSTALHSFSIPGSILRICIVSPNRKSGKKSRQRTRKGKSLKPEKSSRALSSFSDEYQARWRQSQVTMQQPPAAEPTYQLQVGTESMNHQVITSHPITTHDPSTAHHSVTMHDFVTTHDSVFTHDPSTAHHSATAPQSVTTHDSATAHDSVITHDSVTMYHSHNAVGTMQHSQIPAEPTYLSQVTSQSVHHAEPMYNSAEPQRYLQVDAETTFQSHSELTQNDWEQDGYTYDSSALTTPSPSSLDHSAAPSPHSYDFCDVESSSYLNTDYADIKSSFADPSNITMDELEKFLLETNA